VGLGVAVGSSAAIIVRGASTHTATSSRGIRQAALRISHRAGGRRRGPEGTIGSSSGASGAGAAMAGSGTPWIGSWLVNEAFPF